MAANTTPIFVKQGNMTPARLVGANTTSDASSATNLVTVVTAATDGTRVDGVRFRNAQATAAASTVMVHRIFWYNGVTYRLVGEVATAAATRSTSVVGATSIYTFDQPMILKTGETLLLGQSVYAGAQDQFDAQAFAGDY